MRQKQSKSKRVGDLLAKDQLEVLDSLADNIQAKSTNNTHVDGIDLISLGIKSLSGTEKIGRSFFQTGTEDKIYNSFHEHFKVLDELNNRPKSSDYLVESKKWGEISLHHSADKREIKIGDQYHALAKVNQGWQVFTNKLTSQDIEFIKRLPQNKQSLVREYSGTLLAEHLLKGFESQKKITWTYNKNKREEGLYEFCRYCSEANVLLIEGKNQNGKNIYQAQIHNGQIEVKKNDIPIKNLSDFVAWKQQQRLRQEQKLSKKSIQKHDLKIE